MKKVVSCFLIAALMFSMFGCGSQSGANGGGNSSGVNNGAGAPGAETETPGGKPAPELAPVPAIVFDTAIDDPIAAKLGAGFAEGKATLKLTLYETAPGVYSGDGSLVRAASMSAALTGSDNSYDMYYRLSFQDLKPGAAGRQTTPMFNIIDQRFFGFEGLGESLYDTRLRTNQMMPAEYKLTVEGDTARLYLNIMYEFEFTGSLTEAAPKGPDPGKTAGRGISVNSTFYETGKSYNHEYRAMLTATASGSDYTGELCVYGSGKDIPFVDEAVKFTLLPFDEKAYAGAGGNLPGGFDAFGVISASAGKFIVLLDGERPLIEPAGSNMVFYGSLIASGEAGGAQRAADESKQLMRQLYDNVDKTKCAAGSMPGYWYGVPPWYPGWLMPKPIKAYAWTRAEMMNEMGFNKYTVHYIEDGDPYTIIETYLEYLSGMEDFRENTPDGWEVYVYFTKGVYDILIRLVSTPTGVDISVTIT